MPFLVFRRDHLRSTSGIIFGSGSFCGPIWGSYPVWGSFAVGDHLRRCTLLLHCCFLNRTGTLIIRVEKQAYVFILTDFAE